MAPVSRLQANVISIPTTRISDWASFHAVFAVALGFPEWYGCNMDAWIDCMTHLHSSGGMTAVSVATGEIVVLRIEDAEAFERRCPDQHRALVECTAIVNHRQLEQGQDPVLALMPVGAS